MEYGLQLIFAQQNFYTVSVSGSHKSMSEKKITGEYVQPAVKNTQNHDGHFYSYLQV
jgi:hypothetical protein